MSQGNHNQANRAALVVLADTKLTAQGEQLAALQKSATEQLVAIPRLEREAAARAILAGLTLHRVKASLAHGEWMPWLQRASAQIGTSGSNLKEAAKRQAANQRLANYYMKLATAFVAKAHVTKPDLLALPGDQTQLLLEGGEGEAREFFSKLSKFVGGKSLNELLSDHGIKGAKKLGGDRDDGDPEPPAPDLDPEALHAQKIAEASDSVARVRRLFVDENILADLDPEEAKNLAEDIASISRTVTEAAEALSVEAAKPAEVAEPAATR